MANRVQQLGGTTSEADALVQLERELYIDTSRKELRVGDGVTAGGTRVARQDLTTSPAATNASDGKATAAQITELESLRTDVTTNSDDITTLELEVLALESDALLKADNLAGLADKQVSRANLDIDGVSQVIKAGDLDPNIELGGPSLGLRSIMRVNEQNIREDITVWEYAVGFPIADPVGDTLNVGTDNSYNDGDRIVLASSIPPTGLASGTVYYVVNATATTIQLSATYNGAPIDFTTAGTIEVIYKAINASTVGNVIIELGSTVTIPLNSTWRVL